MSENRPTLIIACNNLEATEIFNIAEGMGFHCIDLKLPWSGRLYGSHPALTLGNIGPLVVLIEQPAPEFEQRLREAGRVVEIIDHHLYIDGRGEIIDRRRPRSSLEQFVGLFGARPLTPQQRLIAANARGSWPALIELAKLATHSDNKILEEIWAVRRDDLACRIDRDQIDALLAEALKFLDGAEADNRLRVLGCGRGKPTHPELILVRAEDRLKPVLIDALYLAHYRDRHSEKPRGRRWRRPECLNALALEVLVIYEDEQGQVTQVEYSGTAARRPVLDELVKKLAAHSRLMIWAGGGDLSCFFGAETGEATAAELSELADRLLDSVLGGNRPLVRWRTQFLQVLRYNAEKVPPTITPETGRCYEDAPVGEPVRNYVLDYMRPFLAPRPEPADREPVGEQQMRTLAKPGPVDPWSLTMHSYHVRKGELLPRFRVLWQDGIKDERSLSQLAVHFLFGGLIVLEWAFQDGWPEHDAVQKNAKGSLFRTLLCFPVLDRDGDGKKQERPSLLSGERTAFSPYKDKNHDYDDEKEYPTIDFATGHVAGIDCLAELIDFNDAARQCYSSFFSPFARKELSLLLPPTQDLTDWTPSPHSPLRFGEKTQNGADRPAAWFADLIDFALQPFELGSDDVTLVLDERARVVTAAACVGCRPTLPAAIDKQEVLFARLTTVEPFEPAHFYDREFLRAELAKARYDRFRTQEEFPDSSQLFGVTDHSLVMLGYGWFAANVAIKHVACQYHRLFLIGLLYVSVFHRFSHELGRLSRERLIIDAGITQLDAKIEAAANKGDPARADRAKRADQWRRLDALANEVRGIQAHFTGFANGLWFDDVSTQIQGRELFQLITRQLRVAEPYREINDETERTEALEAKDAKRREELRARELTVLGTFVGTLVAMGTAFAPIFDAPWIALITIPLAFVTPIAVLSMTGNYKPTRALAEVRYLVADFAATACDAVCAGACSISGRFKRSRPGRLDSNQLERLLTPSASADGDH